MHGKYWGKKINKTHLWPRFQPKKEAQLFFNANKVEIITVTLQSFHINSTVKISSINTIKDIRYSHEQHLRTKTTEKCQR